MACCNSCPSKLVSEDIHNSCVSHARCFTNSRFDPRNCTACNSIFASALAGNRKSAVLWSKRLAQMDTIHHRVHKVKSSCLIKEADNFVLPMAVEIDLSGTDTAEESTHEQTSTRDVDTIPSQPSRPVTNAPDDENPQNLHSQKEAPWAEVQRSLNALHQTLQLQATRIDDLYNNQGTIAQHEDFHQYQDCWDGEDEAGSQEASFSDEHEEEEVLEETFPTKNVSDFYIVPPDALVDTNVIELQGLVVTHGGAHPMVRTARRNGRQLITPLRPDAPGVQMFLRLCTPEEEVPKETGKSAFATMRLPLREEVCEGVGWRPLKSSFQLSIADPKLTSLVKGIEDGAPITPPKDSPILEHLSSSLLAFATAPMLSETCAELQGILASTTCKPSLQVKIIFIYITFSYS